MMRINSKTSTQILKVSSFGFAGLPFGKKRAAVQGDLPKYDVVIVGGHLGSLLSNHLDAVVGPKASIFAAYDSPTYNFNCLRVMYEKGLMTAPGMQGEFKKSVSKFAASSQGLGATEFRPNENAVVLKGGRKVEYDHLVIATGLPEDPDCIKGFNEAWADEEHPFFTNADYKGWKYGSTKPYRFMYNFNGGNAYFYIPPAPFHGQIEAYNFLATIDLWNRDDSHGKICMENSKFTIVNANNTFCAHSESIDSFIKEQIEKYKIDVEYGTKLVEVKKDSNLAVFENQNGQKSERPYDNFYSLLPAKTDPSVANSGLADANGLLDVDQYTLQHKKFDNIFGLGDVTNLPTSKNFFAGFNQLHVVRHNLERRINGFEPNAKYDGAAEAQLHIGINKLTNASHKYDGAISNTLHDGFMAVLSNKWAIKQNKSVAKILEFKNWGPPYYKLKKSFSGSGEPTNPLEGVLPAKKETAQ